MDIKTNTTKYGRLTVPTKVITGPDTRFSYLNAWEPKAIDGGKPKYSVSLIIPKDEAYANSYFVNANSASAPGIVDADRQPIIERSEMYSGIYGRASINFYAFNVNGNRGIACGLNNLQKLRDGEPLGGKASAEADFATDDDDDFLS